jgi:effector-binding domain-containing protein
LYLHLGLSVGRTHVEKEGGKEGGMIMSLKESGIEHKQFEDTLVATVRINLKQRKDLPAILDELIQHIPGEDIIGPPFCIFQFVTSVQEGFDAEVGFPVRRMVEAGKITTRMFPAIKVLSLVHTGPAEGLQESYRKLYGYAAEHGLISDEFAREVYPDWNDPEGGKVEVQFVIHDWNGLLARNLERVLGETVRQAVMQGGDALTMESTVGERFQWVKGVMEKLDRLANEDQKYDVVSSCAHIFPQGQIDKLKTVYEDVKAETGEPLKAVDAVIEFMAEDPGWGRRPVREGSVIYSSKAPRDPQGYANAKDEIERRQAYCFCPLVRANLDRGMSITFCYCGAGWYRLQWEGAIGRPVRIEVVQSILKGDDVCKFAIHLPGDLS